MLNWAVTGIRNLLLVADQILPRWQNTLPRYQTVLPSICHRVDLLQKNFTTGGKRVQEKWFHRHLQQHFFPWWKTSVSGWNKDLWATVWNRWLLSYPKSKVDKDNGRHSPPTHIRQRVCKMTCVFLGLKSCIFISDHLINNYFHAFCLKNNLSTWRNSYIDAAYSSISVFQTIFSTVHALIGQKTHVFIWETENICCGNTRLRQIHSISR